MPTPADLALPQSSSLVLDVYRAGPLERSREWEALAPEERRRRAVAAARDRDTEVLWSLTEAYLALHSSRPSVNTLKTYRWAVQRFLSAVGEQAVNVLRMTHEQGLTFQRTAESTLGPSSARVQLAGARLLFKALRWAGATDADPLIDVKPVRDPTPPWEKRSPYSELEITALCAKADVRERALILLCAHGGLRISEALTLTWEDVDFQGAMLTVRGGKGGRVRRIHLTPSLSAALRAMPRLQPTVIGGKHAAATERLKRLCDHSGVPYRGHHAMRHYNGTRLVREGATLDDVARHLGHASIETTRVYAKWSDEGLRGRLNSW